MINKQYTFKEYLKTMTALSKGYGRALVIIFIGSICFSVISIFIALIGKELVDSILSLNRLIIVKVIAISISAYILGSILGFATSYFQKYIIDQFKMKLQLSFYDNMQHSEFMFFSNLNSSDVYYRMFTDIGIAVDFYLNLIIAIPIKIIVFLISFGIMLSWSYQLTLTILALITIQLIVMTLFKKPIKQKTTRSLTAEQQLIAQINNDVLNSDTIRSLGLEKYNRKKIEPYFEDSRKAKLSATKVNLMFSSIIGLISQIINICLLLVGILYISQGKMSIGTLMGFSMMTGYIYQPLNDCFSLVISYQPAKVSYSRYREFNDEIDSNRNNGTLKFTNGELFIDNISFSYGNGYVFNKFSDRITSHKIIYYKGQNGAGKTTLMRLIARFIKPIEGNIYINDININDFDYDDYRKNIIAFTSNPIIFNGTVKENICLDEDYDLSTINEIIKSCSLTDTIDKLEKKIETLIGTDEQKLSQGEIQKIGLARVLIRKPKILILDEPIAHIDSKSTNDIIDTLKYFNIKYGITMIIISHDDAIQKIADEIHEI